MSFTITQTGIEQGATQVLFLTPPIIADRYLEGGPAKETAFGLGGHAIVSEYTTTQDNPTMMLKIAKLDITEVANLHALLALGGVVTVKLSAASATTVTAIFGPRPMQRLEPIVGHYPETDAAGGAIPNLIKEWWSADLVLYRV